MERLIEALDMLAARGEAARFWLRDDDAVEPSAALDRLLDLTGAAGVPVTLAVIPALTGEALARRLEGVAGVSVAVHGWAHANHAGPGEKTAELGAQRPVAEVLGEVARGLEVLAALHPGRLLPVLVPPWNRIAQGVAEGLAGAGFAALSVFGAEAAGAVPQVNTHVDVIDWKGSRGGRDPRVLVDEICARLEGGGVCGLLTHHLVHDEAAWIFMRHLVAATAAHPGAEWVSLEDLIG